METDLDDQQRQRVDEFRRKHRIALLTMLFTDIVGSTGLKQALGDRAAIALIERHHALIRDALGRFAEAEEIDTAGDSFFCVFAKPSDAAHFALIVQRGMRDLARETGFPVLDRIGIHVGEVFVHQRSEGARDLFGIQIDTTARIMSLGGADQILLSRFAFDNARQVLRGHDLEGVGELSWLNHGYYEMKGVEEPVEVCEVGEIGAGALLAPGDSEKAHRFHSPDAEPVLGWRPSAGQRVPNTQWTLERALGEGGFGEVWLARHETLKQRRVIKFCFRADRVRSLKREVTLFRILRERVGEQRGIVTVHDVFFDEPPYYIVMDYVDGPNLAEWTAAHAPLADVPLATRLEIVAQVADALQVAHDAGVIHRDVKPSNILVAEESGTPQVKLTDFGIGQVVSAEALAGMTKLGFTQTMMSSSNGTGTQLYMAPELLTGLSATTRSDLYSLGVVLYQLITGDLARPVTGDWADDIADPLLREDLRKCLAGDAAKRFTGAGDLAARLRSLDQRRAARTAEESVRAASERRAYRRGLLRAAAAALVVVALVAALAIYGFQQARIARNSGSRAERSALEATRARTESDEMLTRMQLQRAEELFDVDDASGGIAYLSHVLRRNPQDRITAARLLSSLRDRSHGKLLAGPWTQTGVHIVGWEPQGKSLLVMNGDTILRWRLSEAKPDEKPLIVGNGVGSNGPPLMNPDGTQVLCFHDWGSCRLYDARSGAALTPMLIHDQSSPGLNTAESAGMTAAFSPDGRWLATVLASGSLHLWNVKTGAQIGKLAGPPTFAAFHPNGKILAVGLRSGRVEIRDADGKDWKLRQELNLSGSFIRSLRFTDDRLVVETRGRLLLYRMVDGQAEPEPTDLDTATSYDLSPDASQIAVARVNHTVELLSMKTGKAEIETIDAHEYVNQVSFSADGLRLLVVTERGVQVWSSTGSGLLMRTRQFPTSLAKGYYLRKMIHLSPDCEAVAIAQADGSISVWRVGQSRALPIAYPMRGFTSQAAMHPNGELLATGNQNGGEAAVWNLQDGSLKSPIFKVTPEGRKIFCLSFQPGTEVLWTGMDVGSHDNLKPWHWPTGQEAGKGMPSGGYLFHVHFDSTGGRMFYWNNHHHVLEMPSMREIPGGWTEPLFPVAIFAKDGRSLLQFSKAVGGITRWKIDSEHPTSTVFDEGHPLYSVAATDNNELCVAIHDDGTAQAWDTQLAKPLSPPVRHQASISDASLHQASGVFATASSDHTARLWRIKGGEALGSPMRHHETVYQATLSPDGHRLATSSYDHTVRLWDVPTGRPLTEAMPVLGRDVQECLWHPDGKRLITSGRSPAQCWDVPAVDAAAPVWLPDWAEAVGGFHLDAQGEMTALPLDADQRFRQMAKEAMGDDIFARNLRWFYEPEESRTLSPDAVVTTRDLVSTLSDVGESAKDLWALNLAPEDPLPWTSWFWDSVRDGEKIDVTLALRPILERLVEKTKHEKERAPAAWVLEAILLADTHPDQAMTAYREALKAGLKGRSKPRCQSLLADLLLKVGQWEDAARLLGDALGSITPADRFDATRSRWIATRRTALTKAGDNEALASDNAALLGLQARSAAASPELVNLGAFYNKRLDEGITGTDQTFNEMPYGIQTFAGVPFDARGLVLLRARSKKVTGAYEADLDDPLSVTGIPVESKCQRLHFLHCVVSPTVPSGKEIGAYVIHYSDGQEVRIPLRLDREFGDRHRIGLESLGGAVPPPEAGHKIAWQGHDKWSRENPMAHTCTYLFTWENPRPEVPVKSLDIVSHADDAGIAVFGITRE